MTYVDRVKRACTIIDRICQDESTLYAVLKRDALLPVPDKDRPLEVGNIPGDHGFSISTVPKEPEKFFEWPAVFNFGSFSYNIEISVTDINKVKRYLLDRYSEVLTADISEVVKHLSSELAPVDDIVKWRLENGL